MAETTAGTSGSNETQEAKETSVSSTRTDTSKVLDELSRSNQSRRSKSRRGGFGWIVVLVVILLPLTAALGWLVLQQLQTRAEVEALQSQAREGIEEFQVQTREGVAELQSQTRQNIQEIQAQTREEMQELQAQTREEIQDLQFQTRGDIDELRLQSQQLRTQLANLPPPAPQQPAIADIVDPQQLERELRALRTAIESRIESRVESRIESLSTGISELQRRIESMPQPGEALSAANEDWLWSEAEYQLRIANQKLQLEGDAETALFLLGTVSDLLRETEDPALLEVRQAVANEIVAVRSIERVDSTGLYVRMDSLNDLVNQLSLRSSLADNYNQQLNNQRAAVAEAEEEGFVARTLALLSSIFVWQRWDDAPEAVMPLPQEATLKQNLHLLLGQAQLALLMRDDTAYRSSLRKAADWTSTYFAIDNAAGRTLSDELGALAGLNIVEQRPDISSSLETLRRYNAARERRQSGN